MGCLFSPIGCILSPLRFVLTLVFAIVVFAAFAFFLMFNAIDNDLLSAEFYTEPLADNDVYNRFYDEVLLDEEFVDTKDELLGDIEVPTEDIARVARSIITPDYLQAEVERAITNIVDYLNKDTDELELYIELGPPLENAKTVLLGYVDKQVDALDVAPVETEEELEELIEDVFRDLEAGVIPNTVPSFSVDFLPVEDRVRAYEEALEALRSDPGIPKEITDALDNPATDRAIRKALETGDLKEALKVASEDLATPLIDDALDELRKELSTPDGRSCENFVGRAALAGCTRYDVLQLAAEASTDSEGEEAREEFLEELDDARDLLDRGRTLGSLAPLLIMAFGMGAIAFFQLPRISRVFRSPGIVLAFTGLVFLVIGLVLSSALPDRLDSAAKDGVERTGAPFSVSDISVDVLGDMAKDVSSGFVGPSIYLLIIGGILFGISFFLKFIPFMLLGVLRR